VSRLRAYEEPVDVDRGVGVVVVDGEGVPVVFAAEMDPEAVAVAESRACVVDGAAVDHE